MDSFTVVIVFKLQMFDFLHVYFDLDTMSLLQILHLRIEILDFTFVFTDLLPTVVVKVVDHILFNLD